MIGELLIQSLNGIYYGSILFMIASGLTVILGILDILNIAHGELYAVGAYMATTILGYVMGIAPPPSTPGNIFIYVLVLLGGCLLTASLLFPIGAVIERVFMRPVYDRHELYQLLATFGLLFIIGDIIRIVWGDTPINVEGVYESLQFSVIPGFDISYPFYNLFVIFTAIGVFASLLYFFSYTKRGRIIRATAIDREIAITIGVNQKRVFTVIFAIGTFLAGFGGAIVLPPLSATLNMGMTPLILSFVIIVIGGLGSIKGAFVASMLVGLLSRWAIWIYPPLELAAPFAIMILILLYRPEGLFRTWSEKA